MYESIIVILLVIVILFIVFHCNPYKQKDKLAGAPVVPQNLKSVSEERRGKTLSPEDITRQEEQDVLSQLMDPTDGKCMDPKFPFLNPTINKCVQCYTDSWNCLTGFQRCRGGICVKKNSPQCAFSPFM